MNQRKRLSRLEKLAAPVIERVKKGDEAVRQKIHDSAVVHAVNFAVVAVYGEPKLEEPLAETWPRCIRSPALQDFEYPQNLQLMTPFGLHPGDIASYLDGHWVPTLPGNTEKEKFDPIFSKAPPWLVWFTFADWTASVLKLALPDLSEIKKCDRSIETLHRWPRLPKGKFELRPLRDDLDDLDPIALSDLEFWREKQPVQQKLTRLERKRFNAIREKLVSRRSKPAFR